MPRLLAAIVLIAVSAAHAAQPAQAPPSRLADVLAQAGIPADGLPATELAAVPSDFAVEQRPDHSAVVYHVTPPASDRVMHVRRRDNGLGTWRTASLEGNPAGDAELTQVRQFGGRLVVEAQAGAYRGRVFLIDEALVLRRRIDAVLLAVLPDGTMVVRENAETTAHPLAVALYAPAGDATSRIHPVPPWSAAREQFIERARRAYASWGLKHCIAANHPCNAEQFDASVVSELRFDTAGTRLAWVTRFDAAEDGAAPPIGNREYVIVACTRPAGTTTATCRERPFRHYDGPDGSNTESALSIALSRRSRF